MKSVYVCVCGCVCVFVRERGRSQMSLLWDSHICWVFFNDSKIHAIPFLFPLSLLPFLLQSLCSLSFHTSGLNSMSSDAVPICGGQHNCWHDPPPTPLVGPRIGQGIQGVCAFNLLLLADLDNRQFYVVFLFFLSWLFQYVTAGGNWNNKNKQICLLSGKWHVSVALTSIPGRD